MEKYDEYTTDDFRHAMPPRVFGTETEYSTDIGIEEKFGASDESPYSDCDPMYCYANPKYYIGPGRSSSSSIILTTGGELYYDNGPIEYATPECRTPQELVAHERAGEELTDEYIARLAATFKKNARLTKRAGFAKVEYGGKLLMQEDSLGHHESYFSINSLSTMHHAHGEDLNRLMTLSLDVKCLTDFLALRKLIDGIGMVNQDHFSISQKPLAINYRKFHDATTHGVKRPLYQGENRFEVRTGEGGKSDWSTEFKIGLTSLVLRLIEHKATAHSTDSAYPMELLLDDPNVAIRTLARDPHANVNMRDGTVMRGMDVLKGIVDKAVELQAKFPDAPSYEMKAVEDFYRFYDDLELVSLPDNDVFALSDRIDWAARYGYLVQRGASYDTFTSSDLSQVRDDLKWDMLGDPDLARRHFRKFGHTVLHADIPAAPATRARARVEIAGQLSRDDNLHSVFWERVISRDGEQHHLTNPFSGDGYITRNEKLHFGFKPTNESTAPVQPSD